MGDFLALERPCSFVFGCACLHNALDVFGFCRFLAALVSVSEEVRSRCHLKHRVPPTISESTSSDSISGDLAAHTPHLQGGGSGGAGAPGGPHPPVSPQAPSAVSPGINFTNPAPFPSGGVPSSCGGMSPKASADLPVFAPAGE